MFESLVCKKLPQRIGHHGLRHRVFSRSYDKLQQQAPPAAACASFSSSSPATPTAAQAIVELREYDLYPQHIRAFLESSADHSDLRKSLAPLRFFSVPETGGRLNVATHAYYYGGGHSERTITRKEMASHDEWNAYVASTAHMVQTLKSTIFVEAPLVSRYESSVQGLAKKPSQDGNNDNCIIELRRYYLKLGYDTVPKFMEFYEDGLPSKLNAVGTDPTTSLVTVLYSEVGRLNEVIEIWRHGNGTAAMEQSRVAARGAQEWRQAIASIADLSLEFTSTIHKPASFSPLQ